MKRIIKIICALALALTIALGCVACGGGSNGETQKTGLGYEVDRSKMFGICVLPSDLPTSSKDPGITTEIVCDLIQTMNIKSVRVWMHIPYVLERVGYTNELRLKESTVQVYHDYFAALDEAGVENILVMSHQYLYPVEMIPQPTYNGVVPDPVTELDDDGRGCEGYGKNLRHIYLPGRRIRHHAETRGAVALQIFQRRQCGYIGAL